MSTRPKADTKAATEATEQLALAFAQLDQFGDRLDKLKQAYNETAKELSSFKEAVDPPLLAPLTPIEPFRPVAMPALPAPAALSGRYSVNTPLKSERPMALDEKPKVPRPDPRPKPVQKTITVKEPPVRVVPKSGLVPRKASGRFYIQVSNAASTEELRAVKEKLAQVGRVVDSGLGTAVNPEAGWIEVAVRDESISSLIAKLRTNDLREQVEKVIEVQPGEGRLQARQLDLFRLKRASQSDI